MDDFETFFAAHYAPVLHSVRLATGDAARAEDMTQEAFARAFHRWRSVSAMERPVAWVYVVALNAWRRNFREHSRETAEGADIGNLACPGPDEEVGVLNAVVVRQLLDLLPPRQRAAVVLRYLAGLSIAETAQALHCAEGTVKSAVHAALATLRERCSEESPYGA